MHIDANEDANENCFRLWLNGTCNPPVPLDDAKFPEVIGRIDGNDTQPDTNPATLMEKHRVWSLLQQSCRDDHIPKDDPAERAACLQRETSQPVSNRQ